MFRYLRLLVALGRFGLARELAFRGNFVAKVLVEVLWLGILLVFYRTVFARASHVAGWSESEYLFFVGCYFAMEGLLETFCLSNCSEFAEMVRSGDLDFLLLKPIDEQFLVTLRSLDWSTVPNVVMGTAVMGISLRQMGWEFDPVRAALFAVMFACGLVLAYSFLLILTSLSVWMVRNQSLYEQWWLVTNFMRYPREIFKGRWGAPLGWFFSFVMPVMLVVSVPANVMVRAFQPGVVLFTLAATAVTAVAARQVFRLALRRYRSASS